MSDSWLGWHFLAEDKRLRYGDNREVIAGETLRHDGYLGLCASGFHASRRAIDALNYAPGPVVCRVSLSGQILEPEGEDKACASERTVIAMSDATRTLAEWSIWCAEQVLHLFEKECPDDDRPRKALAAKRQWLDGEISDEELDAAWDAAMAAAWAADWAAAGAAARAAAGAAAWAAAWAAARVAAGGAAWSAARVAAGAAAGDEYNGELERRLLVLLGLISAEGVQG